jgi:DNA repair photolyase
MRIGITERGDAALDLSWRERLDEVDGVILITKDPRKLLREVNLDTLEKPFVVHSTITGYGGTALEPRAPSSHNAMDAFWHLHARYGSEVAVLRVDPVIPFSSAWHVGLNVMVKAYQFLRAPMRVRISFLDLYPKIREDVKKSYTGISMFYGNSIHAPLTERKGIARVFAEYFTSDIKPTIEICGEPDMDCSSCVSAWDVSAMGLDLAELSGRRAAQRASCPCLAEKTELLTQRKQCAHGCVYCYWR